VSQKQVTGNKIQNKVFYVNEMFLRILTFSYKQYGITMTEIFRGQFIRLVDH